MVAESTPSAAIITDPEILPELVRPLVAAFEAPPYDAVVNTTGVGGDRDAAWLLPTRVTVRDSARSCFTCCRTSGAGPRTRFRQLWPSWYAETEARYGHASTPAGRRPLGVEFRPRPRQVFRFVFGVGLQPRDVLHALEEVPTTFQPAVERCRRKEDILESFARDYVEPTADERKRPGPNSKLRRPSDSGFWADIGRHFDNRRGPLTVGNQLVRRSWMPAVQKYCFCDGSTQP